MENIKKLETQAVEAAFNNNWKEAINLNKEILQIDKNNLDAILRLAFAYFQNQEFKKAKSIYKKGLKVQPNNPVILNYLKKIDIIEKKKSEAEKISRALVNPEIFLEIPGKTKSVALVNLGQKEILAKLNIGEK
jgi:Flp pilus assembly protein TadD, contains TPR repeats